MEVKELTDKLIQQEFGEMAKGKEVELKGIVPGHKSLTKAERKRLMKKAIGGFKRAGLTDDDFKELLPDESEKINTVGRE